MIEHFHYYGNKNLFALVPSVIWLLYFSYLLFFFSSEVFAYRLAIEKDPDHIRSMVVLGQSLMQKQWLPESIGVLEHAVRKV